MSQVFVIVVRILKKVKCKTLFGTTRPLGVVISLPAVEKASLWPEKQNREQPECLAHTDHTACCKCLRVTQMSVAVILINVALSCEVKLTTQNCS